MTVPVSESEFYMWRTLFAIAHADNVVTTEEVSFMSGILDDIDFTDKQAKILKDDIVNAKDVTAMFAGITDLRDRVKFFDFARDIVWVDGNFAPEEQSAMTMLYQQHMNSISVDDLVDKEISLEFEEGEDAPNNEEYYEEKPGIMKVISAFKYHLLGR